jgi:hypothetical protein
MNAATLAAALDLADSATTLREAAAALRSRFAPLRVMAVDAADMRDEKPAAAGTRRALYLGASDGHCWRVTAEADVVAGLFIADRDAGERP